MPVSNIPSFNGVGLENGHYPPLASADRRHPVPPFTAVGQRKGRLMPQVEPVMYATEQKR